MVNTFTNFTSRQEVGEKVVGIYVSRLQLFYRNQMGGPRQL
jgi:hypothetical protein